jgi:hypothetical protein
MPSFIFVGKAKILLLFSKISGKTKVLSVCHQLRISTSLSMFPGKTVQWPPFRKRAKAGKEVMEQSWNQFNKILRAKLE